MESDVSEIKKICIEEKANNMLIWLCKSNTDGRVNKNDAMFLLKYLEDRIDKIKDGDSLFF